MPTSNGQWTTRDIRQAAITETLLRDNAVATAKLADVSVTVAKTDEPVSAATDYKVAANTTLDTTWRNPIVVTLDVPTWSGLVVATAISDLQVSASGGNADVNLMVEINDDATPESGLTREMDTTVSPGGMHLSRFEQFSNPGATVSAYVWFRVGGGTSPQNTNFVTLGFQAIFLR
jgi:hypothetical protein